eukprot:gene12452-12589_t
MTGVDEVESQVNPSTRMDERQALAAVAATARRGRHGSCAMAAASYQSERDEQQVQGAAAVSPALIGADGLDFTQVEAAQNIGLSGKGIRICIIDQGVEVKNPNFGNCTAPLRNPADSCRIFFGFNTQNNSTDPNPTSGFGTHGTHVAGIAAGSFPYPLLDSSGTALPYQRGVAYEALIGAVKADTETFAGFESYFEDENLQTAVDVCLANGCDIINMSLEKNTPAPSTGFQRLVSRAAIRGVTLTTAAGNQLANDGPMLFGVASPAAYGSAWAVAHLHNTANPGALLQISAAVNTTNGWRDKLSKFGS